MGEMLGRKKNRWKCNVYACSLSSVAALGCSLNKYLSYTALLLTCFSCLFVFFVFFLRPDREEASVMPLINAGFNRVSLKDTVYFILPKNVVFH